MPCSANREAIEKAQQLGGKPVTCSDSTGWIYDPEGIDVELLKENNQDLSLLKSNTEKFNRNLIVVPAYTAKGLEFDSVIIYTEKNNSYKLHISVNK